LLVAILVDSFSNDVQISIDGSENNLLDNISKSISPSTELQAQSFELPVVNPIRTNHSIQSSNLDHLDLQEKSIKSRSNSVSLNMNKKFVIPRIEISTPTNVNYTVNKNRKLTVSLLDLRKLD